MSSNETAILNSIIEYIALKRHFHWRNNTGAFKTERGGFYRFGSVGSPDIFVLKNGIIYGLEVKDKSKLSDSQIEWASKFGESGGIYCVVRSIEDVQKIGL